jgi:hypothetical protein
MSSSSTRREASAYFGFRAGSCGSSMQKRIGATRTVNRVNEMSDRCFIDSSSSFQRVIVKIK